MQSLQESQTDKLRESAHIIITANNRLRQEVMDKMVEIQALHTKVLCHAVDTGCRDPQELRKFLCSNEGHNAIRSESGTQDEAHVYHAIKPETTPTFESQDQQSPEASLTRRGSDAPSPTCGINCFKHGNMAHQRAERKLRTQLSEP